MKYELIKTDISTERTVMQDVIVDDVVTGQEATDDYEVTITMGIHPTDGIGADFSKDIIVTSNNSMTGFQVDEQRQLAVDNYLQAINIDI